SVSANFTNWAVHINNQHSKILLCWRTRHQKKTNLPFGVWITPDNQPNESVSPGVTRQPVLSVKIPVSVELTMPFCLIRTSDALLETSARSLLYSVSSSKSSDGDAMYPSSRWRSG